MARHDVGRITPSAQGLRTPGVVLIVSSDEDARVRIAERFTNAGFLTSELDRGEDALTSATESDPSVVVLDLELLDMSGYVACYELRERVGSDLPIIFLSGERTEPSDRVAGLLIGADDYVTKPFDPDEILVRARRLLSRGSARLLQPEAPLTPRELEILQLLADGMSQQRIAKDLFISSKTVGTHIQRILSKLGVHSRTEAVAVAYQLELMRAQARSEGA